MCQRRQNAAMFCAQYGRSKFSGIARPSSPRDPDRDIGVPREIEVDLRRVRRHATQ